MYEFLTKSRAFSIFSVVAETGFGAKTAVSSLNKIKLNSSSGVEIVQKKINRFDGADEFVAIHRKRSVEQ